MDRIEPTAQVREPVGTPRRDSVERELELAARRRLARHRNAAATPQPASTPAKPSLYYAFITRDEDGTVIHVDAAV